MKTLFYIIGGIVCVALIISAMYVALTIGLSVYIAHMNTVRGQQYAQQQRQNETQQMQQSIASLGDNMTPDVEENKRFADELSGKGPTLFEDKPGYGTEDNWLATAISREVAGMAYFAAHPGGPAPDLKVKAVVDPAVAQVHVEIDGFGAATVTSDLKPVFAWDAEGYAALAKQLLGTTPPLPAVPVTDENDALTHLLKLTGPELAEEDVRLSANLQAHPDSWQDHEEAALLLTALTLRDAGGAYTDKRPLLNRATAHLAVAQALRGNQPASWPGLVADAAVRTLSGRETDALAHLKALSARDDLPGAGKTWIAALRTLAKQDWREAGVSAASPLLLKIVWFEIAQKDLMKDQAARRLLQVVPVPPYDPNVAPDAQKTNPETLLPDWGRIAGQSPFYDESDDDVKNAEYRMGLEFHEIDEILQTEKAAPFDLGHLDTVFAEEAPETVSRGGNGKAVVQVIGPGGFKTVALGNIFDGLISNSAQTDTSKDAAAQQNFFAKTEGLFHGVPGYEMARLHLGFVEGPDIQKQYAGWEQEGKKFPVWYPAYTFEVPTPGYALIKRFYRNVVPFGTVYDIRDRMTFLQDINPVHFPSFETPELEALKKLPPNQAIPAINAYMQRYNARIHALPTPPPPALVAEMQKMDPDDYDLALGGMAQDKLAGAASRFLDYNLTPIALIEDLDEQHLSDNDRIEVLKKHVALDPNYSSVLADLLRKNGRDDEAAAVDRNDLDDITGPDVAPSMLMPLVNYDLDHGLYDEVAALAKKEDLTTENGQEIYLMMLERTGRLDEAETYAKQMQAQFKADWPLSELYVRYRDHFPAQFADEQKKVFPEGMTKVTLASFSDPPLKAAVISDGPDPLVTLNSPQWRMIRAGLQRNEVVVALNGYRVESALQYDFIADLSDDPAMDFIVWREPKFAEIKANVPHRKLNLSIWNYKPPE